MVKKFNIHEWQSKQQMKQWLREADDFTPDLEDDELKRSKIQQMMAKEKGLMDQGDYDKVSDILGRYSLGEFLDAAAEFYQTGGEDESAELAKRFAADFRKFLDSRDGGEDDDEPVSSKFTEPMSEEELDEVDIKRVVDQSMSNDHIGKLMDVIRNNDLGKTLNTIAVIVDQTGGMPEGAAQMIADLVAEIPEGGEEEEIEEQNTTGTGASFSGGEGEGYASPGAFAKNKDDWENSDMIYEYGEEEPAVDDQGNPVDDQGNPIPQPEEEEVVDTATELAKQFKSLSSDLKKPAGQKGFDKKEIEMFSIGSEITLSSK